MRIAVDARCLEWQRGGVARYLLQMFRVWTATTDHRFILYFQNSIPGDEILRHPAVTCKVIRGPGFLRTRRILAEQFLLPWMLWRDRPDVLYAPWYTSPLLWPGRKTAVAIWDITYSTHPQHYSLANQISLGWFSRIASHRVRQIFTCSFFDGRQIEKYYGVPSARIKVLLLAVDQKFGPLPDDRIRALRAKYGFPARFLLSLGNFYNRRDIDTIVKAFAAVRERVPGVGLVVIGKNFTEPRIDFDPLLKPLIDEGRAVFLEWIPEEDLVPIYAAAWYYISTSNADGEAMMLKEAMKCGTPVITSEFLRDAIAGMGVIIGQAGNLAETAEVFAATLGDEALRDRLARESNVWVQQFTWERVAAETMEKLEQYAR